MSDRELLLSLGYIEHRRKRVGCMLHVWWWGRGLKEPVPQGYLARHERELLRYAKAKEQP